MCPPEVMVKPVGDLIDVLEMKLDALALGPGIGFDARDAVLRLLLEARVPTVVDADALTILAEMGVEMLEDAAGARLLTPHPGEMSRLTRGRDDLQKLDRRAQVEALADRFPGHTFLLKGNRTVIATQGQSTWFNSTGHPGMASGGMGDVLTGASVAWLGQGLLPHEAAGLAAWSGGRAAELNTGGCVSAEESVIASDVTTDLGRALGELKRGAF